MSEIAIEVRVEAVRIDVIVRESAAQESEHNVNCRTVSEPAVAQSSGIHKLTSLEPVRINGYNLCHGVRHG